MRLFEGKQHATDRKRLVSDLESDDATCRFVRPKRPRTSADLALDTVEVVKDATWEGVIKDVGYEGIIKKGVIGVPVSLYHLARPQAAHAPEAAEASLPQAPQASPEIELSSLNPAVRRALLRNGSLQKQRSMRPASGLPRSKTDIGPSKPATDLRAGKELDDSLKLRRSGTQRFGSGRFTDQETKEFGEPLIPATRDEINRQLKSGSSLASNIPHCLAVLRPGLTKVHLSVGPSTTGWKDTVELPFGIGCDEPLAGQLLAAILKGTDLPADMAVKEPTTLALRLRGPEFQTKVADPVMQLGKVQRSTRANGETVDIDEQVFFTLFDGVLRRGADGVGPSAQVGGVPLYDFLADAESVAFCSPNVPLANFLNGCMKSEEPRIRDLRARLAMFEVAKLNYFENAEIKEATKEFLAGTIVGAVGELAIEFIPPINKKKNFDAITYVLNVVFGGAVDFVDNYKGRMGAVTMGSANAAPAALKQQQNAALKASACGAVYGTLLNFAAQYPIALKAVSPGWLMAGTALSIVGSSLSIPFQMQADRTRKTATTIALLKQGIATLPADVLARAVAEAGLPPASADATSAGEHARLGSELIRQANGDIEAQDVPWQNSRTVRAWADQQAVNDMSMSIASTSSTWGFTIAPLLSGLWAFNFIAPHVESLRTAMQSVIFGVSPGAENLSTAAAAVGVSRRAHKQMNRAALGAIAMAAKGSERVDLDAGAHDQQARATLGTLMKGMTRALSDVGNINVLRQKSLL